MQVQRGVANSMASGTKARGVNAFKDVEGDYVLEAARQYTQLLESADPDAIAIYLALWNASHVQALANSRAIDALELPVSVSGARLTVLRTLYFAPERQLALNEISKASGLSPAMVTHLVEGLSRGGLIKRIGSPDDRRVRIAQLTSKGEEAFHTVLPVISKRMTEACAGFSQDEKETLLRLLHRLF
jgi:DNA-binding MarR family transcriptional regulator